MNIYRKAAGAPGIPIVPMLDILTILLIFFIVDNTQVLLEVASDGALALGGRKLPREELSSALRELLEHAPQSRLQVAAADEASLGALLQVLDTLDEAGLQVEQIPLRIHTNAEEENAR